MSDQTTALARALPAAPLETVQQLTETFRRLEEHANIVTPVSHVDYIPPMHRISLRSVMIDPEVDQYGAGAEVYRDPRFCKDNERAPGKIMLTKLMAAAGVQIIDQRRLDDRSDPNYCEMEVVLGVRDYDGTPRQVIQSKVMDLRAGAPETMKPEKVNGQKTGRLVAYEDTALADKRRHIQSHAETKAIERGLRMILNLRQKYTLDELAKPFVVPKLIPALDPNDPDQKAALIGIASGSEAQLWGPRNHRAESTRSALRSAIDREMPDHRQLPEATAPALSPADELGDDGLEFDETAPPVEAPYVPTCGCPCGHAEEISHEVEKLTVERLGSPRCGSCFPGRLFQLEPHKHLTTLGLKKYPAMTPAMAEEQRKKSTAKGA